MTFQVIVTERAEADARAQAHWYDTRCLGLGRAFKTKVDLTISHIQNFPEICETITPPYRRAFLGRFPYFIAYRIVGDSIRILRVLPEKGDPKDLATLLAE